MRKKYIYKRRQRRRNLIILLILTAGIAWAFMSGKIIAREKPGNENPAYEDEAKNTQKGDETPQKPEPKPEPKEDITVKLAATGDIMFHPSQIEGAYDKSADTYDFKNSFKMVKKIFDAADISIANFEGTTAGNEVYAYQGYPLFNAPDEVLDAIKYAGIDVLSTVNNHSLDTRKAGIIRTLEQIQKRGMDTVGTYASKPETRVLMKEVKGIKIAFIAYTEMVNGLESLLSPADLDAMVNVADDTKIKEDIKYAKENNADVIIAFMHWGDEYSRTQAPRQEKMADMMFTEGVDIILGSHPHVIQPSKNLKYDGKDKFVIYSMGNFISNQRLETLSPSGIANAQYTEDGIIVNISIEKKGETGEVSIKGIEYIPLWVYKGIGENGRTEHVVYPVMEYIESNDLTIKTKERMSRSYNDTMAQMDVE